ncbi:deoxyribose-phosphate aldolase [Polaribacter aestuariivivens]|uniref:Deoxyribose-phosphate aldolase n=1 Tax=Polaribacter aestuariivivens TaxID=2304626 RepID=A0A5S3N7I6_9FLAO|nr:DUF6503 family protein [Polaribacter aestuariivivens]TMM31281.1 deoxyribose-phosphate aldolase [Polaribacter aestuariivivens]
MRYLPIAILFLIIACKPAKKELTAQQIIDKTIKYSGADKVANSEISFTFRGINYAAVRNDGSFKLFRNYKTDSTTVDEVLTNIGYEKYVNAQSVQVSDTMISKYSNSINSVHYFSVLPFGLNDKAVRKKLLKPSTVNGKGYHKIEITFTEDGGGEDFEDVFIYWIGKDDFLIDYLAYAYHTNGGGKRFRVLKEQCVKNGIRFVDYHNYKPLNKNIKLINIDKAFEENQLEKVSEIVLKDINVTILK